MHYAGILGGAKPSSVQAVRDETATPDQKDEVAQAMGSFYDTIKNEAQPITHEDFIAKVQEALANVKQRITDNDMKAQQSDYKNISSDTDQQLQVRYENILKDPESFIKINEINIKSGEEVAAEHGRQMAARFNN